jgi:pyruvate kinase
MGRAKTLATLGPASNSPEIIEKMISAGLDAVRINMSHGTWDEHAETIIRAKAAAKKLNRPLAVLVDLSGPKIRTGLLQNAKPVILEATKFRLISKKFRSWCRKVTRFCSTTAQSN